MSGPLSALQRGDFDPSIVREAKREEDARRRRPVEVWVHNDDYTPAEYVVRVLEQVFELGLWKATWVMARAHLTGKAMVGVYPLKVAERRVAAAEARARGDGWPLRLSITDAGEG